MPKLTQNQTSQTAQPAQQEPTDWASLATPTLLDGTLIMLIVTSFFGLAKMSLPGIGGLLNSKQKAELDARKEVRQAEIDQDAKTQQVLHDLIESYAKASQETSQSMLNIVIKQVVETLSQITETQTRLLEQVSTVAETQASLSDAQRRTLEVLIKVEQKLGIDVDD